MKLRKILSGMLAVILAAGILTVLNGCGGQSTYKVTVKDAVGNPYTSGIIVRFMQGDNQIAMQACDKNGVAQKSLPKGDYTVSLNFTDKETEYYYEEVKLTAKETEKDLILSYKASGEPENLFVASEEFEAYNIGVGCTYVNLAKKAKSYFLFVPKTAGTYKFSVADGANAEIGHYGAPHFVQSSNIAEMDGKSFTISVSATMIGSGDSGTSVYVIGVEPLDDKTENCIIAIERTGDAEKTIEDEPWDIYEASGELKEYTLPAGATLSDFDLTASTDKYKLVFNDKDGYYHLNSADGPLVLVRLAEDCEYIACFKTMLDRSGVVKYFFDKDDKLEKKESYSECLLEYIKYVDEEEGVYPLNKDLEYIIKQRGEYVGWWDSESNGYIFKEANGDIIPGINSEIAWLLMCCYIG